MKNEKTKQNKNLIYILLSIVVIILLVIGAIFFLTIKSDESKEDDWTTEDLILQSELNRQESVAKQLYLQAKIEYTKSGNFPETLEDFANDIESIKDTLPNLEYTRYGSRGFVITYTDLNGKEQKLTYTAE